MPHSPSRIGSRREQEQAWRLLRNMELVTPQAAKLFIQRNKGTKQGEIVAHAAIVTFPDSRPTFTKAMANA